MRLFRTVLVLLVVFASPFSCTSTKPPVVPPSAAECEAVCTRLRTLKCEEGDPSPGGVACEKVCQHYAPPAPVGWNLQCLANVQSCSETKGCGR